MESTGIKDGNKLSQQVGEKEERKLKAQRENKHSVWSGLGMFGMVGWSVAIPTLLGVALGIWLDKIYPVTFSWTLTLLVSGLFAGCVIAWYWITKERKEIHKNGEDDNE